MSNRAARRRERKEARKKQKGRERKSRGSAQFTPPRPAESLSAAPLVAEERAFALFERFDGFAGLRNGLRRVAEMEESWAGIPMPLDGHRLVIEPH
ncbi:hypothetical protein DBT53_004475, partial [Aerococcus mictus]|uniref:hypothetical protein n=1 Tax=Aerococcus mictus TaxID=2976810 RepID=UPI002FD77C15